MRDRLKKIQSLLDDEQISPNCKNDRDHVVKIICGQGKGSGTQGPVLKKAIPEFLEEEDYEFCAEDFHGVFLVRLEVG